VLWEIARRCSFDDHLADDYAVPYFDYVTHDPSFEEMKKVVCVESIRPSPSPRWNNSSTLTHLSKIMQECWHPTPCVRLTSLRVKKSLGKLRIENNRKYPEIKIV